MAIDKRWFWTGLAVLAWAVSAYAADEAKAVKRVLIVTGQDYPGHKWQETAPVLAKALGADSRLRVSVSEDPKSLASPDLGHYDAVVLHFMNWEQPDPGPEARANLKRFVEGGKGLMLVHFACGAFQEWPEFRDLAGRSYDPKMRPHDPFGTFRVDITEVKHPITKGMKPFETTDELYTCLAGERPVEVLATARSKVDGKDYPMAFAFAYGAGRVFHSPLGHDAAGFGNAGVAELLRRGCAWVAGLDPGEQEWRRISVKDYVDKMKSGWVGKMVGCAWGAPTEFKFREQTVPEDQMPKWNDDLVNSSSSNDDLYVQMTFMETLDKYGLKATQRQAGIDFANSPYDLWHANKAGRDLLRKGIAPPDSGHPQFNKHADDIDYQIEADFAGLVSPGLPDLCIELGEKFGRLMNYGDGLYGGQWVAAMYAEAFFESDPIKLIQAGLKCIPEKSQYYEAITDVLNWYRADPNDWEKTWQLVEDKYQKNKDYRRSSCDKGAFNIDAKFNGAYIAIGMLYGKGDLDQTVILATRCGQDSDCNPGNAAGPMFTTVPFSKLPPRYTAKLDMKRLFQGTTMSPETLFAATEKIARESVAESGGRIEKDVNGEEVFVIPVRTPKPSPLEQCWSPGPPADSKFTEVEMALITVAANPSMNEAVEKFAHGWKIADCGPDMNPGLRAEELGRKNVLVTHPLDRNTACVLSKKLSIPAEKKTRLNLTVGHHPDGDWDLIVKGDGNELLRKTVGKETAPNGWMDVTVDLTPLAGKIIYVELLNQPTGWAWEAGYWANIAIESE